LVGNDPETLGSCTDFAAPNGWARLSSGFSPPKFFSREARRGAGADLWDFLDAQLDECAEELKLEWERFLSVSRPD
jgi:hypothetical protein